MTTTGADPRGDRAADGAAGPGRVGVTAAELARARRAYRGGLEAARAWRAFSPDPRHHDATYWTLIATLFAEPGTNRTRLVDRMVAEAGVSRSTAERAVRDARAAGLIVAARAGGEQRRSEERAGSADVPAPGGGGGGRIVRDAGHVVPPLIGPRRIAPVPAPGRLLRAARLRALPLPQYDASICDINMMRQFDMSSRRPRLTHRPTGATSSRSRLAVGRRG